MCDASTISGRGVINNSLFLWNYPSELGRFPRERTDTKQMATKKSSESRGTKQDRAQMRLRRRIWGGVEESRIWSRARPTAGFTTIPRGLQHALQIMDDTSKGKPPSSTYFTLWCWARDAQVVDVVSESELAFESGFTGQRMVSTWRQRVRLLDKLGFIRFVEGRYGPISHILILNPFLVIKELHAKGEVQESRYQALLQRLDDVGAKDLAEE